jgi:hypothetical protein
MDKFEFQFNQKVRDKVTGFEGIILGRTEYATGCIQYGVCPSKLTADGKVPDWHWFDGGRLIEVISDGEIKVDKEAGGPHPSAPSMD